MHSSNSFAQGDMKRRFSISVQNSELCKHLFNILFVFPLRSLRLRGSIVFLSCPIDAFFWILHVAQLIADSLTESRYNIADFRRPHG